MTFREDGRVQGLLEENDVLKKENADLAKKYAAANRFRLWYILLAAVLFGISAAFCDKLLLDEMNPETVAHVVAKEVRRNPHLVYDRQAAAYLIEKTVQSSYREGVRDAREEFEASRRAETQAQPVLSADGRDLTMPPPSPPTLPLNTVVYGRITAGDVDSYLFHAQAGERVVFRMQSTVGSWLSPHIVITTAEGRTKLAGDGSSSGLGADRGGFATLEHTFETSGTYIVFCGPQFSASTDGGAYALSARHR